MLDRVVAIGLFCCLHIARCVRALVEAEYGGVIVPEHFYSQCLANAVAYLKKLTGAV